MGDGSLIPRGSEGRAHSVNPTTTAADKPAERQRAPSVRAPGSTLVPYAVPSRRIVISSPVEQGQALSPDQVSRMEMLGITRVPVDYFYVAGFRYTQLKDAISQAERQLALK